jgi:UDP-N-acetylmuramyl tripeptide synthase
MKNESRTEIRVRVDYAENPQASEAAMELLRTGFRRGLTKLSSAIPRNIMKDGEA